MNKLDAIQVPLIGKALFEASAGTGKTYTIASLYLRYIVEQPVGSDLKPENILVVTFTRKATAELRDRIRQRLHQAVGCFRGQDPGGDDVIRALVDQHQDDRDLVLKRLYAAEKSMDDAAIFTIHSFCHRAITQNAFTSGAVAAELVEDESQLIQQACEDFWRCAFYGLSETDYRRVAEALNLKGRNTHGPSPTTLGYQIAGLLSRKSLRTEPEPRTGELAEVVQQLLGQEKQAWHAFQQKYQQRMADIGEELKSQKGARKATIDKHIDALAVWLQGEAPDNSAKDSLKYVLEKAEKTPELLPTTVIFSAQWHAFHQASDLKPYLLSQALDYVSRRVEQEKEQRRIQAPDDLMKTLSRALNDPAKGEALSSALRSQYPVAMIDEFQDTDPLQFNIFQHIYAEQPETAWLMIGDPKQSIYSFRGADIHTYTAAKTATGTQARYTLDKNYRSASNMVEAVNDLYGHCQAQAFLDEQIQYEAVDSQDKGDKQLQLGQQAQAALTFWQFSEDHRELGAAQCAEAVSLLLNAGASGEALIGKPGEMRPVRPGDIAILVRDRNEAREVAEQLRKRRVRSVFLSRDSVFSTPVAEQLLRLVRAFHEPRSERLLLAAMATPLCDLSATTLAALRDNEMLWQQHQQRFEEYQQTWLYKGILAAVHQWMADYRVPAGMLADDLQGERELADVMHAAELLQAHALKLDGSHSLLRHFTQLVECPDANNRAQQRRLESDSELVQIVTIHASKGLEYPVVMLPFGLAGKASKSAIYAANGETLIDFAEADYSKQQAEQERLAEDVRLLYVALTRAVYACFVGLTKRGKSKDDSALGYLLNSPKGDPDELNHSLAMLVEGSSGRVACQSVVPQLTLLQAKESVGQQRLEPLLFSGRIDNGWRVTSYSGMARHQHSAVVEMGAEDESLSVLLVASPIEAVEPPEGENRFTFKKGAQAGNALHFILEQRFSAEPVQMDELISLQIQSCGLTDSELWTPVVQEWLDQVCATPLLAGGPGLDQIPISKMLPEMEFHLNVSNNLRAPAINRLLAEYPLVPGKLRELDFSYFHGLIKGFIDLIFEVDGKYYVCDYKSNHLGNSIDEYSEDAMAAAMGEHRYDAQLVFYILALHRFLQQQIADYDYDHHIGGGVYLFLRGMSPDNDGQTGIMSLRPARALIEKLDQLMGVRQ